MEKFCNTCVYLHPKEREQTKKKRAHICWLSGNRVYHKNLHPYLPRPSDCIGDAYPLCNFEL